MQIEEYLATLVLLLLFVCFHLNANTKVMIKSISYQEWEMGLSTFGKMKNVVRLFAVILDQYLLWPRGKI